MNCWNPKVSAAPRESAAKLLAKAGGRFNDYLMKDFIVEDSQNPSKLVEKLSRHELRSAVIGMVLGDSNLHCPAANAFMQMAHSPKVEDYVIFKKKIVEQIPDLWYRYKLVIHKNRKLGKEYPQFRVWTKRHPFLTKMRKRLYRPNKRLTKGILESLTSLGLALWYMDDGHLSLHYNARRYKTDLGSKPSARSISTRPLILCTHSFSEQENEVICQWLRSRWDINARVKHSKGFFVYMNTTNARKFVDIVRPFVLMVPSMHHKINFKYTGKSSSELLRYNIEYWITEEGHECATSCKHQDGDIV